MINTGAKVWVMDRAVQTVANSIPDARLHPGRSPQHRRREVRRAALFRARAWSGSQSGTYQAVTILGLDDTSLFGRPELIEGNIENIFAENGLLAVKDAEFAKLENPTIGTEFEINDHRGVIVGDGQGRLERAVRRPDALHDLQPGHAVHPERRGSRSRTSSSSRRRRPTCRIIQAAGRHSRLSSRSPRKSSSEDHDLLHLPDRASARTCC